MVSAQHPKKKFARLSHEPELRADLGKYNTHFQTAESLNRIVLGLALVELLFFLLLLLPGCIWQVITIFFIIIIHAKLHFQRLLNANFQRNA